MPRIVDFDEMPIDAIQLIEGDMWYHVGETCEMIKPILIGDDGYMALWFEISGKGWVKRVNHLAVAQVKHRN